MILGTEEERSYTANNGEGYAAAVELVSRLAGVTEVTKVAKATVTVAEEVNCPILASAMEQAPVGRLVAEESGAGYYTPRLTGDGTLSLLDADPEAVRESAEETGLCLSLGEGAIPLSGTAMTSLVAQAFGGRSSVFSSNGDCSKFDAITNSLKSGVFNECLRAWHTSMTPVTADGMVRYVGSDDYVYLPIPELLETLEKEGRKLFPALAFSGAMVSHSFVKFTYKLNDTKLEREIARVLSGVGYTGSMNPMLVFVTSNIGLSGANLYPVVELDHGAVMELQQPLTLEHKGQASLQKFSDNIGKLAAAYAGLPARLQELADTGIAHPAQCYRNVAAKAGVPVSVYTDGAADFEEVYGEMATFLDLYSEMALRLQGYFLEKEVKGAARIKMLNNLGSRFLSGDLKLFDTDVSME